jgi:hypothetical protein
MRSNVSNALVSPRPCIVLAICCCASARFFRAMRMFFLRLASSILLLSRRSASFSFSTACFCAPLGLELPGDVLVLLLARERLAGQAVVAAAHGDHGLALPLLGLVLLGDGLLLQLLLVGDRDRDRPSWRRPAAAASPAAPG